MSLLQIFRAVVGDPHFAARLFPNQGSQRKIDRDRWRSNHQRRATLRTPEEDELCRMHLQADFLGLPAVIYTAEYRQTLFLQQGLDALESFRNRVGAAEVLHPVVWS